MQQGTLDVVGVATQLALLDVAVGTGHVGAAGLLGRLHRLAARIRAATAIHAVAVAAALAAAGAHLGAALVGTGHEVFRHALGIS